MNADLVARAAELYRAGGSGAGDHRDHGDPRSRQDHAGGGCRRRTARAARGPCRVPADGRVPPGRRRTRPARAGRPEGCAEHLDAGGYISLLRRLRDDVEEIVYAPGFERVLEQAIAGSIPITRSARVIVTEGNYLLLDGVWAGVRPLLDEVWYARPDENVRMERLIARHVEFGRPRSSPGPGSPGTTT